MSLTDEDKRWFSARLDTTLKRLETTFDLTLERLETKLDSKIERVETALLTEFRKWASPNEARVRTHTAALRAIDPDWKRYRIA
jgi:hypothetical protein